MSGLSDSNCPAQRAPLCVQDSIGGWVFYFFRVYGTPEWDFLACLNPMYKLVRSPGSFLVGIGRFPRNGRRSSAITCLDSKP